MNKTIKGVISLIASVLVIAVMIGALVWQRSREPEIDEAEPAAPQSVRLVESTEDELTRVTFTDSYGTLVMLPFYDENDRVQWMVEGYDYILSAMAARNKIRGAFSLSSSRVVHEDVAESGLNLADFGFNPPSLTVTAYYADGTTLNIYLGGPTADFAGYFIMVEGDPGLYTISSLNAERLLFSIEDMLDTSLPFWDSESVQYMLVAERGREVIEIETVIHEETGFPMQVMLQPFTDRDFFMANFEDRVLQHFHSFALGDLVSLHPADLTPYGLDNPSLEFIYRAPHGEAHLLFGDRFFREVGGRDVAFIYVKFADRPHVFEALYEPVSFMYDLDMLRFVERFVALINILYVERMEVTTPDDSFDIRINHIEDTTDIAPTINGDPVNVSGFRRVYMHVISLAINSEVTPFTPEGEPLYTVAYILLEDEDTVVTFFEYDANFLAVSINGEDVWFVTERHRFNIFLRQLRELVSPE